MDDKMGWFRAGSDHIKKLPQSPNRGAPHNKETKIGK